MQKKKTLLASLMVFGALNCAIARADDARDQCLLQALKEASPDMTVSQLKAACDAVPPVATAPAAIAAPAAAAPQTQASSPNSDSLIRDRQKEEAEASSNRYAITAHRPNYLLLAAYSSHRPSSEVFDPSIDAQSGDAKKTEAQFQISLKAPFARNMFGSGIDWYAAYTEHAFWQVYNKKLSSPFRETVHEPETWLSTPVDFDVLGMKARAVALGFNHQSNGRGGPMSRSWNRIFGMIALDYDDNFALVLRPWWRIPEDSSTDDNPDISSYIGNFDITGIYRFGNGHTLDMMVRDNLQGKGRNRGAIQLGWSFPLFEHFKGYAQWFYGYGESLIDYNVLQSTFGVGVQLTDW